MKNWNDLQNVNKLNVNFVTEFCYRIVSCVAFLILKCDIL